MKKKIFRNNLLIGILILLLCVVLFVPFLFRHDETQAFDRLKGEARYLACGVDLSGETYLNGLDTQDRITWIDADGTVLYDNEADAYKMPDHSGREEVADAFAQGEGQSIRWSETLLEYELYYALRLADGTVMRLSCTRDSVLSLLLTLAGPMLGILLAAAGLCALLSYRLAGRIVTPINQINLQHPTIDETYAELRPLVTRLQEQNLTIRDQMEELKKRQREFSALTENMCEGFLLVDDQMQILSGNATAYFVLDHDPADGSLKQEAGFPPVISAVEEALTGIRTETIREKDGRSWQIIANPVLIHGRTLGAVVLLLDVTEREQRESLRQEFSANISHELKTPLTSISGFAELICEGLVPPEKVQEFAGDIYQEARRLIDLVDDSIRLSRLDEGVMLERETVDLYALCEEVVARTAPTAERQSVSVSLEGEPVFVEGVRQILQDMITNLCDNAVKYNRPSGSVTVRVGEKDNRPYISVSDTGIGIPYAEQDRVFERFYRVDKSHSKEVGGTGLGLSIVRHAAEYHNADLSLESVPGKGTRITVTF